MNSIVSPKAIPAHKVQEIKKMGGTSIYYVTQVREEDSRSSKAFPEKSGST